MNIVLQPIAITQNARKEMNDDNWGNVVTEITLNDHIPTEAFDSIEDFNHLEVIYYFNRVVDEKIIYCGRPRGNPAYPKVGICSQRKKDRPNKLGLCTVKLLAHNGRTIIVQGLDALNGTPVLDIKPVFREFQPKGEIEQPEWVEDLMRGYW